MPEIFADHTARFRDDNQRPRIFKLNSSLYSVTVCFFDGSHDHTLRLSGVSPFSSHDRDSTVFFQKNTSDPVSTLPP